MEETDGIIELESTITCPRCGHSETEAMPTDSCQWYYDCKGCGAVLKPKPGDCCVYCTYGTVPCPPIQRTDHAASKSGKVNRNGLAAIGARAFRSIYPVGFRQRPRSQPNRKEIQKCAWHVRAKLSMRAEGASFFLRTRTIGSGSMSSAMGTTAILPPS